MISKSPHLHVTWNFHDLLRCSSLFFFPNLEKKIHLTTNSLHKKKIFQEGPQKEKADYIGSNMLEAKTQKLQYGKFA